MFILKYDQQGTLGIEEEFRTRDEADAVYEYMKANDAYENVQLIENDDEPMEECEHAWVVNGCSPEDGTEDLWCPLCHNMKTIRLTGN